MEIRNSRPIPEEVLRQAVELLRQHVDTDPCSIDHNGNCQAHLWFDWGETRCRQERTKRFLAEYGKDTGTEPVVQRPEGNRP